MAGETRVMDLNADVGESYGPWPMGHDAEIMPFISSANIACGGHAGDPNVMAATVKLARQHGVAVGAHPGYPDIPGFGRRIIRFAPDEITRFLLYQLGALWAIAKSEGADLQHVKPHGALYNLAATDRSVADAISAGVKAFSANLPVMCLPGSVAEQSLLAYKLTAWPEGFADRAYEANGLLRVRSEAGSMLQTEAQVAAQVLNLASGFVQAHDGATVRLRIATICLHSDTPQAASFARAARAALESAGYSITAQYAPSNER